VNNLNRYGDLYKLIEEAEQGVSKEEGDALKASFESDAFAVDQLIVYMRQVGVIITRLGIVVVS
jgi:signal recognition particle GTPase